MNIRSGFGRKSRRFAVTMATLVLLVGLMPASVVLAAPPGVSLEQCRNGSAAAPNPCPAPGGGGSGWVSGNVGASQAHLLEGYSIPYRAVMTNLPLGTTITLVLGYDIRNSGANAIDYLAYYNRLLPHGVFGHSPEVIDPRSDIPALAAASEITYPIPEPSSAGSPVTGQPGLSFNALPEAERKMAIFGGTFFETGGTGSAIAYVTQGSLTASQSETTIAVTFKATSSTVVLAWGGHIARGDQWNGASASAISGSPYHMRTKSWNLSSLGNQDRSLSADAVVNPPKLIVIKHVVNDDGGDALASAFTMNVTGGAIPNSFPGAESPGTIVNFPDTATYAVSETGVAGYTQTGTSTDCSGTIKPDETKTCTITNNDVAPTLALDKTVVNNAGGSAVEDDFKLTATPTSGSAITDAGGDVPATAAKSNMAYTLSESTTVTGYTAGTWSCSDAATPDRFSLVGSTVTLDEGAVVSCGITNTDVAPTLALNKTVVNNAGGNAVENDFVLSATPPVPGTAITDGGGDVPATTAQANVVYTLSETTVTGYTAGSWNCTGTGIKAFDATAKTVSLNAGAIVSCSITNTDVAPTLALNKTVVNNAGGNAVENDFVLSATPPVPGTAITDGGGDVPATAAKSNTAYTLSETSVTGYTAGTWSCSDAADPDRFSLVGNVVTLDEGAAVSCSITNTDVAPTLALNKTVVNNAGGNAVEDDFKLTATPTSGTAITDAGGDVPATAAKSNTAYTLSETSVTGYTAGTWNCTGSGIKNFDAAAKTVELDEGAVVSCAITNTDVAPTLALDKTVVNNNGGGATEESFVLSATPSSGTVITDAHGDVPATTAKSNTAYTLSETGVEGYTAGTWSCSDAATPDRFSLVGNVVTLDEGAVVTCAITNTDSKNTPTGTTVQHWVLHDTLTLAGVRPAAPDAGSSTVTFRLYSDTGCTQQIGDDEVVGIAANIAATVDGVVVTDVGEYRWRATYSGDSFNNGFTTPCGSEITQIYAKDDLMVGSPSAKRNNIHIPYAS
jgi:hypothetical protein